MTMQFSASTAARNYDLQEIIEFGIGGICGLIGRKFAHKIVRAGAFQFILFLKYLIEASALFSNFDR